MSRPTPAQPYAYAPHAAIAVPPNYYYEEPEEYVGDYSENEALSDGSPRLIATPNVTEIYRRKSAMTPTPENYRPHSIYVPPSYYYEAVSPQVPQQLRRPAVPTTYRRHIPVVDERGHYYPSGALEDSYRNAVVYSSPQIAPVRRSATNPVTRHVVRRHPVTVRTPRYYRRPTMANVYKKPSTLCLPVACQPDPAVYRRSTRKHPEEPTYNGQLVAVAQQTRPRPVVRRHSVPMAITTSATEPQKPQQPDYPGELHLTPSDVDAVLARYETILGDRSSETPPPGQKAPSSSSKSSINVKSSKSKLISNMKPKVPSSIKQKQERSRKAQENIKAPETREKQKHRPYSGNTERLELEEITTDVLDSMLSELMQSGCKNKINETPREKSSDVQSTSKKSECSDKNVVQRPPSGNSKADSNQFTKSFNYRDISQNISKSQHNISKSQHNITPKSVSNSQTSSPINSPRFDSPSVSRGSNSNAIPYSAPKPPNYPAVDQTSAMELHRSKSYIVSLIDRALSKELGTVPERLEAASPSATSPLPPAAAMQGNEQMNARQAINLINKNFDKMDKGLCLEITQALTDSIVSNTPTTCACAHTEVKHSTCSCNVQDEPLYVKQLKQLRWGHLKHIQREVRRLEDLERFLDSCSSGSLM